MSKLKPYLNELENKDEIKELGKKIVDIELEIDKFVRDKQVLTGNLSKTETALKKIEDDTAKYPENDKIRSQIEKATKKLDGLRRKRHDLDEILSEKEYVAFKLHKERKEAIRMGMIDLFHKAKIEYDAARNKWIKHTELAIGAHEKLKKKKKEMDSIKNAFKAEFGDK
ncbi:MAG: hypothetical protein FJ150_02285 [Euryarchaeota archaeon]|nr:hypothetical protein [Euryarchaeota archaeon]